MKLKEKQSFLFPEERTSTKKKTTRGRSRCIKAAHERILLGNLEQLRVYSRARGEMYSSHEKKGRPERLG